MSAEVWLQSFNYFRRQSCNMRYSYCTYYHNNMHIISQLYDVHPGLGKNHYNLLYNQVLVQQLFRHLACHNKVHVKDHNYIS